MPLEQYLSILATRQLYIPRATEYDDPYDCAFPGSLSDAIKKALLESSNEPEFSLPGEVDRPAFVQNYLSFIRTKTGGSVQIDHGPPIQSTTYMDSA
jgi:hypothetical protein